MKSITLTMKSKPSPTFVLAAITLLGATIGGVAMARTRIPEPCHGLHRCSKCACGSYDEAVGSRTYCRCGHSWHDHY
jgi:hypothetical protein